MNMKVIATGSNGNCYVLTENDQMVLLDLGLKIADIKKGIGFKVSNIEFAFVSHAHT